MNSPIKLAIVGPWNSVNPALQHTVYGDLLLINAYEPLVSVARDGTLNPLGASSWKISADSKTVEFKIDNSRVFSDGSFLKSEDYKTAWESALALTPQSANASVSDIIYNIKGIEDFERTKKLSGIEVPNSSTLIIHLKSASRMLLGELTGVRYSAWKVVGKQIVGSGKYVIQELEKNHVLLIPNKFRKDSLDLERIEYFVTDKNQMKEFFKNSSSNNFYGVTYANFHNIDPSLLLDESLKVITGAEAMHLVLDVNGKSGSIFSSINNRKGLLFLIHDHLKQNQHRIWNTDLITYDPQTYLQFEAGRVDDEVVDKLISTYKKYGDELKITAQRQPLVVYTRPGSESVIQMLRDIGLTISNESKTMLDANEFFSYVYNKFPYDLIFSGFSVVSGDPDGLYHCLGEHGAIQNPAAYRPRIGHLLENGRSILEHSELQKYYEKVTLSVLEEIPYVHLGFSRSFSLVRKNVRVENDFMNRNDGDLSVFKVNK
jgi:ABC-type transport system substrate-binding protein